MFQDPQFWEDERDSPLLSRGFDAFTLDDLRNLVTQRVRSWPDLLPEVVCNLHQSSNCESQEAVRIFQRDAERTFISKDESEVQRRTAKRQEKQVELLKLVYSQVQEYHQGMGFLVAFLQLFLEANDVVRVVLALHQSDRHSAGYFRSEPQAFVRDARVLRRLTEERLPRLASHLASLGAVPEMYSVKWFIGLAVHFLPLSDLLDYWEGFFQYGFEWVLAFGLEFFQEFQSELLQETSTAGVMTILRMEDPRAEWRYPPKLEEGLLERFARINLATLETLSRDSLGVNRLIKFREEEAAKVASAVENARRRMQELEDNTVSYTH